MRLATETIRELASREGASLSEILRRASVSRTAYYSLARRRDLLPETVHRLAEALGTLPSEILEDPEERAASLAAERVREARVICARDPRIAFQDVWHALSLLELTPIERLERSLTRGRAVPVRR
jgi:transcriptional regulator with XRE-family HTH domain